MTHPIISIRGVSKKYQLGQIGMTSLRDDVQRLGAWGKRLLSKNNAQEKSDSRDYWALKDVSFDVQPGEIVGVIGRNGAGKSTLLKILSRITEPTLGEVRFRGRVGSLLEVGTGFHPELSGRDNIFLNGAILGMTKREISSKYDEIIDFAEIGDFIDTPVKRYSSGMYVKLAFAIAAHLEPEILLVDEVLAVGDSSFQRKCLSRMQKISEGDGRTILFVSHSMVSIRRLCQKCAVLEKGKLLGLLPVEQADEAYLPNEAFTSPQVDLEALPRSWGTEGKIARALKISLSSGPAIRFGERFAVDITFKVKEFIKAGMIGLALNAQDGTRVMTLDSDGNGKTMDWEPGEWQIRMSLDRMPVSPGRYYFSMAIGGTTMYDIVESFALWEIETSIKDHESDRGFGGCRIAPTFECQKC